MKTSELVGDIKDHFSNAVLFGVTAAVVIVGLGAFVLSGVEVDDQMVGQGALACLLAVMSGVNCWLGRTGVDMLANRVPSTDSPTKSEQSIVNPVVRTPDHRAPR